MRRLSAVAFAAAADAVTCGAGTPVGATAFEQVYGTGRIGFEDGPATTASFVEPMGLSVEKSGRLVVADAGAERIRIVESNGDVRTLAGSGTLEGTGLAVHGGYQDGPSADASFNHPTAVVVAPDGAVIVADTGNHCLRRIANGRVTTLAGSPRINLARDGIGAIAGFVHPRGLAYSSVGDLYVADNGGGLRKLDKKGTVTTVAIPAIIGTRVLAVSVGGAGEDEHIIASNGVQTVTVPLSSPGTVGFGYSSNRGETWPPGGTSELEGSHGTGHPLALQALAGDEFVFADAEDNDVQYIHRRFGASLPEHKDIRGELSAPAGIAVLRDGRIVIADTGHRRIVVVAAIDRRSYLDPEELPQAASGRTYRIAYLGNSYVYDNSWWSTSTPGLLEARLNSAPERVSIAKLVQIYPVVRFGSLIGIEQYAEAILSEHFSDAAIVLLNPNLIYSSYNVPPWSNLADSVDTWRPKMVIELKALAKSLHDSKMAVVLLVTPGVAELSPSERIAGFETNGIPPSASAGPQTMAILRDIASSAGADCTVDVSDAFLASTKAVPSIALFGNFDWHFSEAAYQVIANTLFDGLSHCHPWTMQQH